MHFSLLVSTLAVTTTALKHRRAATPWQPSQGVSWNYWIAGPISNAKPTAAVLDIDLFDNSPSTISILKSAGAHVICYFSAGSYENWRNDWEASSDDLGNALDGWDGEWWVDIRKDTVRDVMTKRIALAASKGCDAVDPDNVDGYNNDNGLGLTPADSVDYLNFLAGQAHSHGVAIGLKNSLEIIDDLTGTVDFAVNEQCQQYSECGAYGGFISAGKNVFHVEYPDGNGAANPQSGSWGTWGQVCQGMSVHQGFSTILKNMGLDAWFQRC